MLSVSSSSAASLRDRPPSLPPADTAEVAARWIALVSETTPQLAEAATSLLARISPPNWALEWSLPCWLGRSLGLESADWLALSLSNVLGLAYVRLQDDLTDGDLPPADAETAPVLATVLFDLWTRSYLQLFAAEARFWDQRDHFMREWVRATWSSFRPDGKRFADYELADFLALAHLGSPLKICVAGACILAHADERAPEILASLELLLAGGVLLDHAHDWEEDLGRKRFNAFHAYSTGAGLATSSAEDVRLAVIRELMVGDAGRPYFRRIALLLRNAGSRADKSGIPELALFARWLGDSAARFAYTLARQAQQNLHQLAGPILDAASAKARSERERKEQGHG